MPFIRKNLANFFTLLNMFFGFTGIILVLYGNEVAGCYMLFIAAFFDLIDGFVARLLKSSSQIGLQLDSLSDLVSFGILPALIMHSMILRSHQQWVYIWTFMDVPVISYLPFIIAAAAAVRLAHFNLDSEQNYYFKGLPSPANGLFIASLPLILKSDLFVLGYHSIYLEKYLLNSYLLIFICILLSALMIMNFPIFSLKFSNYRLRENFLRYLIIIGFIILFIFFNFLSIPIIMTFYVLLSLLFRKKIITELSNK